jgi:hypothetical protein
MPQRSMRAYGRIPILQDETRGARHRKHRERACRTPLKARDAPESGKRPGMQKGKQKGKLAPRPKSSKVNQFTSARREVQRRHGR